MGQAERLLAGDTAGQVRFPFERPHMLFRLHTSQIVEAGAGDEALAIQFEVAVDVVFSDVQMPGTMSGFGLARWFRQHRPDVKVILTSERVDKAGAADELCDGGPLLSKSHDPRLSSGSMACLAWRSGRE